MTENPAEPGMISVPGMDQKEYIAQADGGLNAAIAAYCPERR